MTFLFRVCLAIIGFLVVGCGETSGSSSTGEPGKKVVSTLAPHEKTFAAGTAHNCFIKQDGLVECLDSHYYFGDKTEDINKNSIKAKALTAGLAHSCALLMDDTVLCWNDKETLGYGPDRPYERDLRANFAIIENKKVLDIAAGALHTCAIKARDNQVACWGDNTRQQITQIRARFKDQKVKAIAGGRSILCGIRLDDSVICSNDDSAANFDAIREKKVKAVKTNGKAACALSDDDRAVCWGDLPADASNTYKNDIEGKKIISFALASESACFLLASDHKLHCFGGNSYGQTDPAGIEKANKLKLKSIFAGELHYCALDNEDKLFCWGFDAGTLKATQGKQIKFESKKDIL